MNEEGCRHIGRTGVNDRGKEWGMDRCMMEVQVRNVCKYEFWITIQGDFIIIDVDNIVWNSLFCKDQCVLVGGRVWHFLF